MTETIKLASAASSTTAKSPWSLTESTSSLVPNNAPLAQVTYPSGQQGRGINFITVEGGKYPA